MKTVTIIINFDVVLAKRKMSVTELSERVGITMANLFILNNGKAKAIRLTTLEAIWYGFSMSTWRHFRIQRTETMKKFREVYKV